MMDKIVDYMLEDTNWEVYVTDKYQHLVVHIIFPCDEGETYDKKSTDFWIGEFSTTPGDIKYIEDKFGITDEETIQELYNRYIVKLRPMILSDMDDYYSKQINESVENKEDLLVDKISQYMIEDTEYEYNPRIERVIIFYPFYNIEDHYTVGKVLPLISKRGYDMKFVNYLHSTYNITDWNLITNISGRYYSILYDKIKNLLESNSLLNESHVNNIDRFVDRVSQSLFNDTKYEVFRYRNEIRSKILYPFYPNIIRNNSEDHYRTFLKIIREHGWEYGMTDEEYKYMRDTYGITDTNTILNIFLNYYILLYTNILEEMDKIRNNPLNNFK